MNKFDTVSYCCCKQKCEYSHCDLCLRIELKKQKHRLVNPTFINMSRVEGNPVFTVSIKVRHRQGCTPTEDGMRLEILDQGKGGFVLFTSM